MIPTRYTVKPDAVFSSYMGIWDTVADTWHLSAPDKDATYASGVPMWTDRSKVQALVDQLNHEETHCGVCGAEFTIEEWATSGMGHECPPEFEPEHGPVESTWFGAGRWPTCQCGYDPHDNGKLQAHWLEHGFTVVDNHGTLVSRPAK